MTGPFNAIVFYGDGEPLGVGAFADGLVDSPEWNSLNARTGMFRALRPRINDSCFSVKCIVGVNSITTANHVTVTDVSCFIS